MGETMQETALPKGSLILVTGTSGYIGSHVANEALKAGYKVRGTARTQEKVEKTKAVFNNDSNYSTAVVADYRHEGAFDEAVQGCSAIIHVASDVTFNPDPNVVVNGTIAGVLSILKSAAKTSSVKRFVLTSSSAAVYLPKPNEKFTVDTSSYCEEAVEIALAPPPYTQERAFPVYAVSKMKAEQAFWRFLKDEKPGFVGNTVMPNFTMGQILSSPGATGLAVPRIGEGVIFPTPSQHMIDVVDNARLHLIAAALDSSLKNERIFAFAEVYTWTDVINIIKELYPDNKDVAQPPKDEGRELTVVPNELGAELLRKWYGQQTGYKPFRQSVLENLESAKGVAWLDQSSKPNNR